MKLPFLNRKRYLVLKCYTTHEGVLQYAPITMKFKQSMGAGKIPADVNPKFARTFKTCASRIDTMRIAATIPAPSTISFSVKRNDIGHRLAEDDIESFSLDYSHHVDPHYEGSKENYLVKIQMPWRCYEETGVNFVLARHIANYTRMNVLSGSLNFKTNTALNVFNLINAVPHDFEIPFNTPMASLYPMSELPLHVECYNDAEQFRKLKEIQYSRFARSNYFKTKQIIDEAS